MTRETDIVDACWVSRPAMLSARWSAIAAGRRKATWAANGRCFDIGMTVSAALRRYRETGDPFSGDPDPRKAGNGSLMRLAPVVLFYHPDRERVRHFAAESSRTTHAAPECLDACRYFGELLSRALAGGSKEEILGDGVESITPTLALPHQGEGMLWVPVKGEGM